MYVHSYNTNVHTYIHRSCTMYMWFYSLPGPPSAPRVVLFDRTLTSITVEWFEPFTDSAHPVLYYEVSLDGGETRVFPSSGRMTTFTGLTHSTGYTIRVRANNTIGFGPSGNLTTATVSPLGEPFLCIFQ